MIDKQLIVSDAQSLAGIATTSELSTYSVDMTTTDRDIGKGEQVYAIIICDLGVTTATSVAFEVVSATDAALSTALKVLASTPAIVIGSLTLGCTPIVLAVPPFISGVTQRYWGIRYTTVGTPGVGKFTAFFGTTPHTNI